jgi:hypothetical protein
LPPEFISLSLQVKMGCKSQINLLKDKMKNIIFLPYLIVLLNFSCKKDCKGPQGDKGDTGATGTAGQTGNQGQPGLSNQKVFYGKLQGGNWHTSSGGSTGNYLYNDYYVFSTFTNGDFHPNPDSATYIVYFDADGEAVSQYHTWVQMPYTLNGNTFNFYIVNAFNQYVNILYTKYDGTMPTAPSGNFDLKLTIITK